MSSWLSILSSVVEASSVLLAPVVPGRIPGDVGADSTMENVCLMQTQLKVSPAGSLFYHTKIFKRKEEEKKK